MPLRILPDEAFALASAIRKITIVRMVQNFIDKTQKRDKVSGHIRKIKKGSDSHAVYYTKKEIDELFAANKEPGTPDSEYGIRIYLGLHGETKEEVEDMPHRKPEYIGHHTVILVCTRKKEDLLTPAKNYIADPGSGVEEGELCPPPRCGSIDDRLNEAP